MLLEIIQLLALSVMLGMVATPRNWDAMIWRYWRFLPCPHPCCYPACDLCCYGEPETERLEVTIPEGCDLDPEMGEDVCDQGCNPGGTYILHYIGTDGTCCYWYWFDPDAADCALDSISLCLKAWGEIIIELGFVDTGAQDSWVQFKHTSIADEGPCDDYRVADCDFDKAPYTIPFYDWSANQDVPWCRWACEYDHDLEEVVPYAGYEQCASVVVERHTPPA